MADFQTDIFGGLTEVNIEEEDLLAGKKSPQEFNIFTLADAIGKRDRKNAWILYQKALAANLPPEKMFWPLMWKIKTLWQSERNGRPSAHFKKGELEKLSEQMVLGYHNARRGIGEIETLIEKVILSL